MNDDVTFEPLPQDRRVNRAAVLCFMRGHKVDIREKDGATITVCLECGYGIEERPA
jgi:hypothetical protein